MRGELVLRAFTHQTALDRGEARPFAHMTYCNIGNPQELQQHPITFFRQVLALTSHPPLMDDPNVGLLFPPDAIDRARRYMRLIPGGTGAYSNSQGIPCIREEVAAFLTERDGVPAHASDIFLTDGASPAAQFVIRCLLRNHADAVMTPIPQYPLYSASIALYGGTQVCAQVVVFV